MPDALILLNALTLLVLCVYTVGTFLLWMTARSQLAQTERSLELSTRAWVIGTSARITPGTGIIVEFVNAGAVPALNVRISIWVTMLRFLEGSEKVEWKGAVTQLPRQALIAPKLRVDLIVPLEISEGLAASVARGEMGYEVRGLVTYSDVFSASRSSQMKFRSNPLGGAFSPSDEGNFAS